MVLSQDRKWEKQPDADIIKDAKDIQTKQVIFIRHGESDWNEVYLHTCTSVSTNYSRDYSNEQMERERENQYYHQCFFFVLIISYKVFNRGFGPSFLVRLFNAIVREIQYLVTQDSLFFDSPLR